MRLSAVVKCNLAWVQLPACKTRRVELWFAGEDISSNGGVGLLELAERRVDLLSGLAQRLADRRRRGKVRYGLGSLLRQRDFALVPGYEEDVNDHDDLRDDLALQTSCGQARRLATSATVGRLDRVAERSWSVAAHEAMIESFIAFFKTGPEGLLLDFDATDDPAHGRQEGQFFHGYYDHYCFLPLYVFCGDQLLVNYLRARGGQGGFASR